MAQDHQLRLTLLLLRLSVFLVLFMWTLDKFVNPAHGSKVFAKFYMMPGLDHIVIMAIGTVQLVIILCFLFGIKKTIATGLVLVMHAVSTFSSYQQYLAPYEKVNLLFFAAWPMLAACFACFYLRDSDTMLSLNIK